MDFRSNAGDRKYSEQDGHFFFQFIATESLNATRNPPTSIRRQCSALRQTHFTIVRSLLLRACCPGGFHVKWDTCTSHVMGHIWSKCHYWRISVCLQTKLGRTPHAVAKLSERAHQISGFMYARFVSGGLRDSYSCATLPIDRLMLLLIVWTPFWKGSRSM